MENLVLLEQWVAMISLNLSDSRPSLINSMLSVLIMLNAIYHPLLSALKINKDPRS